MYQALYRKYRPKNFNDVVGQDVIVKTLKNAIENEKISHAYIFTGPRGTGKTSTAKIFAKTINCKNIKEGNPCDECDCCLQFNNNQNIDVIEIDAASNNGVDEIRELKNKVNLVPSISKYKVYIIDEVHMLSTSAFNALLKTLEEPPAHVIFILATTDPHKVLPTILSRCQRFDFKRVSEDSIKSRLIEISKIENIDVDDEALGEISRLANGGMRDALSIFDQVIAFSDGHIDSECVHEVNGTITQENLKDFIDKITNNNLNDIFSNIDEFENKGKNFLKLVEELILFYKNILLLKKIPDYLDDIKKDIYESFISKYSDNQIIEIIDILSQTLNSFRMSSNSKLIFELSIIKIINLLNNEFNCSNFQENLVENKNVNNKMLKTNADVYFDSKNKNDIDKVSNDLLDKKINDLKNLRVENTLAHLDKKIILMFREKIKSFSSMIYDEKYGDIFSMFCDSEVKAASEEYIVFMLKTENMSKVFNKNLNIIEKLFNEKLNVNYKLISVSSIEWENIKLDFNNKSRVFKYNKENIDYNELFPNKNLENNESSIDSLFKNIVEYN